MLVASRNPPFNSVAHEVSHISGHHAAHAPHAARFMTALQMIGTVLAIPVGLASGYSIYHANFSPEARCQSLRANIISMLDKSADASTLRMLVRRDVAAFEGSCGAVDPDAVAAFRTLLAAGPARAAAAPAQAAPLPAPQPKAAAAKPAPAKPAQTVAKPARREAAASDANWLAAVRRALIHAPVTRAEAAEASAVAPAAARPIAPQAHMPHATRAPALSLAAPAPALPPAASVATVPAPASDHPVPPAPIPEAAPLPKPAATASAERHSGFSGLIAQIPLLGRVVGH
jgi:hypothetical protein